MIEARWLGRREIGEVLALQEAAAAALARARSHGAGLDPADPAGAGPGVTTQGMLLVAEHPSVYTLNGRRQRISDADCLADPELFWRRVEAEGIPIVPCDRGGKLTYHGPGQLVVYCVLDLAEAFPQRAMGLETLAEEILARSLRDCGITALPHCDEPWCKRKHGPARGAWVDWRGERRKLASCGFRISNRVSKFGFALNVSTDLAYFAPIYPCGLRGIRLVTMEMVLGRILPLQEVARSLVQHAGAVLGASIRLLGKENASACGTNVRSEDQRL
ncbi:MAG: lipoyl(octanoyl) transferase LipB [Candidatus Tectomicrobia bacterium]|nr:lipoyl(octanoyl) transferase LipB [Candidatus Tectomicrobia bacterium]